MRTFSGRGGEVARTAAICIGLSARRCISARQGIGSITSSDPHPQDVEDAVYDAFLELERQDPAGVVSIVGLAKMIAYRRGQDTGRKIIRVREQVYVGWS